MALLSSVFCMSQSELTGGWMSPWSAETRARVSNHVQWEGREAACFQSKQKQHTSWLQLHPLDSPWNRFETPWNRVLYKYWESSRASPAGALSIGSLLGVLTPMSSSFSSLHRELITRFQLWCYCTFVLVQLHWLWQRLFNTATKV